MIGVIAIESPATLTCDVLVIGTGAGGASAAATLADAGVDVLLLEEGPNVPADVAPRGLSEALATMWRGGGLTATIGRTPIALAEGCCVGGSTEINSGIFQRAPNEVIERWAKANHLPDFTEQVLAPYYNRAASVVNAMLKSGELGRPTDLLRRAGDVMGWKTTPLERGWRDTPSPRHQISGFATGAKQSMSVTSIPRALALGARLVPNCRVNRLTIRGRQVTGATATARGARGHRHSVTVTAGQVFLCAGSTQTPAILHRSGIRRNIGRSFQIHPTIRVIAKFPQPVKAQRHDLPLVAITEFMPALRFGGSVFTLSTFGLALAEDWLVREQYLPFYSDFAMYYAMIRPDGVGRIRTIPGLSEPVLSYLLTERDWRRLGDGLCLLVRALLAAGAARVIPSIRGHSGWTDPNRVEHDLRYGLLRDRVALMTIHVFGSCPMGSDPDLFPVDPWGHLAGFDNVIVADGSVLPDAPGVNPQATIMALAYRATDRYLAARRWSSSDMATAILELLRVRQWVKNGFVLAPLFFGFQMVNIFAVTQAASAFGVFCLVSSAVYIFNDWRDMDADRQHAKKAGRPLASGRVSVPVALAMMAGLIFIAVAIIWLTHLPKGFTVATGVYLAINLGYSLGIKHISVLELFFVASGFVIRLIAGGYAVQVLLSPWIIIATGMLALLMAAGKRRGDIAQNYEKSPQRKALVSYTLGFLDSMLTALAGGTIVVYLLFCVSDYAVARFSAAVLITSVPVALGLLRYLQLIMVHGHGESPTDLVLGDRGMLTILIVFGAVFTYLIYFWQ